MSIGGGKPEKEWLILWTLPYMTYPVLRSSRPTASSNLIKRTVLVSKHMILPGEHGVVSSLAQKFRETDLFIWQSDMQLRCTSIMRIAPGDNAAPGGTAATGGQVCVIKTHTILRQKIDIGSLNQRMAVTPKIILRNIIGDKEDNIWLFAKCTT